MTDQKTALITGVTGQDGSYLAELLLQKGYQVHGLIRRSSSFNRGRIDHIHDYAAEIEGGEFRLHYGDVTDTTSIVRLLASIEPDEVYHLAAQSHVQVSFDVPEYTANVDALGTLRLLESIRFLEMQKKTRFYQASTSELFGKVQKIPQDEEVPFYPRSPYGVAKLYAYWITKNYREAYDIFACNGILFNHESPRRGENFVTRKITLSAAKIIAGLQEKLYLGNLDAERDWGHARDFVQAMWAMLQRDMPDDFVIATGEKHTVREFVEATFANLGITIEWDGSGVETVGRVAATTRTDAPHITVGKSIIAVDARYFRPTEVELLLGDASKAERLLGWRREIGFQDLVREMTVADARSYGVTV